MISETERAIKLALKLGADEAEAFASNNEVTTIRIASRRIIEAKRVRESGIGICASIGKKVGFSSSNELTESLVERAVAIARAKPPNPDFNGFPEPEKTKKVPLIYDRKLESLPGSEMVGIAEDALQNAMDVDKRITDASGAINLVVEHCAVSNTNGVEAADATTKISGHLTVEIQGLDRSEGQGWLGGTSLKGFKPETIGRRAGETAVKSLGAKSVEPGAYDIILEPNAAAELLYHVLSYAVNGRDVYNRTSYFESMLGKKVATQNFSVDDWGNMPAGLSSKKVDDEGSPTRRTPLIKNGKLVNFIYDWYYGGLAKKKSTGNGLRLGDFGRSHQLSPTPYTTNLVVQSGDFSRGELVEEVDKGLLITRLWYTYPITPQIGDFSTTSRCGFLVSDGEIQGAASQVRIHENLPKLLKRLDGIGKKQEQIITWGAAASICTPDLRFRGVRLT